MTATRILQDSEKAYNEKELISISEYLLSIYGNTISEKLNKILQTTKSFLEANAIFLGAPDSSLAKLIERYLFEDDKKINENLQKDLKIWSEKYDQLTRSLTTVNTLIHDNQRPGILRSLSRGLSADLVWGEEQDIRTALKEAETYPDKIAAPGTYILPPKMLVPDPNTATTEEKADPSQYIRTDIDTVLIVLKNKNIQGIVRILIPVNCSQGHWELFEVTFDNGTIEGAPSLYDPLKNANIGNSAGYKILEPLIKELSKDKDRTISVCNGVQENGYSCMDYVVQTALHSKYSESNPPQQYLKQIMDAQTPQDLRAGIKNAIINNHVRKDALLHPQDPGKDKKEEKKPPTETKPETKPVPEKKLQPPTKDQIKELITALYGESEAKFSEALLSAMPTKDNDKRVLFMLSNSKNENLQIQFDELMAAYLNNPYNPDNEDEARRYALIELIKKTGFVLPKLSESKKEEPKAESRKEESKKEEKDGFKKPEILLKGVAQKSDLASTTKRVVSGELFGNNWQFSPIDAINDSNFATQDIIYKKGQLPSVTHSSNVHLVQQKDSQNTALDHVNAGYKPLVMNAANAYHIGGGFEFNGGTQEESLFFTTDLHQRLYPLGKLEHNRVVYKVPLTHDSKSAPNALYTPNVRCFRKANSASDTKNHQYSYCQPFSFNVFTIAGFDLRSNEKSKHSDKSTFMKKNGSFDWDLFRKGMKEKYDLFFQTALEKGCDSAVAAALSCGAFANRDSKWTTQKTYEQVALAYAESLATYGQYFKRVDMIALDNPDLAKAFVNAGIKSENIISSSNHSLFSAKSTNDKHEKVESSLTHKKGNGKST